MGGNSANFAQVGAASFVRGGGRSGVFAVFAVFAQIAFGNLAVSAKEGRGWRIGCCSFRDALIARRSD